MPRRINKDLNGRKFTSLTVIGSVIRPVYVTFVECVCICGETVFAKERDLLLGRVKSCGCFNKETQRLRLTRDNTKHGEGSRRNSSPEYKTWLSMKARCHDTKNTVFQFYGGKGIKVCDRWINSFSAFLADVGRKPSPSHSIERINSNGHYEPENVRWATDGEQARNRRTTRWFTINGEKLCMTDWAKKYNLPYKTVHTRIWKYGWTIEQALELN